MPPKRKVERKYKFTDAEIKKMTPKERDNILKNHRNFQGTGIGWQPLEAALFRLCLTKYGCGNWDTVSYFLPSQNTAQFNTFTQKLFGQQSLAPFSSFLLDPYDVYIENCVKEGLRKNGVVVHEGPALNREQKNKLKDYWKKRQKLVDFDFPLVENRAINYSKLHRQMQNTENEIEKVLRSKGEKNPEIVQWNEGEAPVFEDFLNPLPRFPKITKWNLKQELQSMKGQDNVWPLIRLVEDDDWLQADQCLHWNFLSGKTFKKLIKKEDTVDTNVSLDSKRPQTEIEEQEKSEESVDDDVEMEGESEEEKLLDKKLSIDQWSTDDLCTFLKSKCDTSKAVIDNIKKNKMNGKNFLTLKPSELEIKKELWNKIKKETIETYGNK